MRPIFMFTFTVLGWGFALLQDTAPSIQTPTLSPASTSPPSAPNTSYTNATAPADSTELPSPISSTCSETSTSSSAPGTVPSAAFSVVSVRSASPIHLLAMNAAGFRFHLGGNTASYCPISTSQCPPGNITAILGGCSMDAEVPGGQMIWATPDGTIGYTQAHSIYRPVDSISCPFSYLKTQGQQFGTVSTAVFGANGLMACPDLSGGWQVFAAVPNATVPSGNVSECLGFDALTMDAPYPAAWQYI